MDILKLNKNAWDNIVSMAICSCMKNENCADMLELFCIKLPKSAKILDIGCGPGIPITKYLVEKRFDVLGIDLSDKMANLARKNVPQAKFKTMSMTEIDFKEEFDGIISIYSMLCLDKENFKKSAMKITSALKDGGYFLLFVNEPPPEGHSEDESITEIMGQKMYSGPYSEDEIMNYFRGLKPVEIRRTVLTSEQYGKEHCLMLLMEK